MNRDYAAAGLLLVTVVAVFAAVQPILPSNNESYSEVGILGPAMTEGGYPTSVVQGTVVHLYGYVGNHEGAVTYYEFMVKLGSGSVQVGGSSPADAPVISSHYLVLNGNSHSTFPVDLNMSAAGTNLKVVFELWAYNTTSGQFAYTGVYNMLRVNVTVSQ